MSEITMKNRRTGETLKIPLQEFKIRFQKELQQALLKYSSLEKQKEMLKPPEKPQKKDKDLLPAICSYSDTFFHTLSSDIPKSFSNPPLFLKAK